MEGKKSSSLGKLFDACIFLEKAKLLQLETLEEEISRLYLDTYGTMENCSLGSVLSLYLESLEEGVATFVLELKDTHRQISVSGIAELLSETIFPDCLDNIEVANISEVHRQLQIIVHPVTRQ